MERLSLLVRRPALFSSVREVVAGDSVVTRLQTRVFSGRADFSFEGVRYSVLRRGVFRGRYELLRGEEVVTSLVREGWTGRVLRFQGVDGLLFRCCSGFALKNELVRDGRVVGSVRSAGWFTSDLMVDLPGDMPIPLAVLLIHTTWLRRTERAAAS